MRCVIAGLAAVVCAAGCSWGDWARREPRSAPVVPPREVRVEIFADATMVFQGTRLPLAALGRALRRVNDEIGAEGIRVVVIPSEDTPYRLVADAVEAAHAAGFTDVMLWPESVPAARE